MFGAYLLDFAVLQIIGVSLSLLHGWQQRGMRMYLRHMGTRWITDACCSHHLQQSGKTPAHFTVVLIALVEPAIPQRNALHNCQSQDSLGNRVLFQLCTSILQNQSVPAASVVRRQAMETSLSLSLSRHRVSAQCCQA